MRKGIFIKLSAVFIIFCLTAGYMPPFPAGVFATGPERLVMEDEYISVSINANTGRFAVRTTGGDPGRETDQDKPVLYEKTVPETSYTSFRINGDEVIFGNIYRDKGQQISRMVEAPEIEGNTATAVWKYRDISIRQTLELMTSEEGEPVGNVRVSYEARNESGGPVNIGARILMDVKVGDNDGPVLMAASDLYPIVRERVLEGEDLPLFWRAVDDQDDPTVAAYGMLYGWADERPSKVVFGHWYNLAAAKYEYEIDRWLEYSSEENMYGTADSAVAVYWDETQLSGNSKAEYATFVGMGDLEGKNVQEGRISVNVTAPKRLELSEGMTAPFEVLAEIDNSYPGAKDQRDIYVDISYPSSCSLAEGEKTVFIPDIKKGEIITVSWKFQAQPQGMVNAYTFTAMVSGSGISTEIGKAYVVMLPSFKDPPDIQYHLIYPYKMHVGEVDRKITVTGENLNYLADNPDNWEIYVQDSEGEKTFVEKRHVEVWDNNRMTLYLPEAMEIGSYGFGINVLTQDPRLGRGFYRDDVISIENDLSLLRRGYGTIVITAKEKKVYDTFNNEYTFIDNVIHYAKESTQVNIPSDEKELFRVSGNIREEDGKYSIIPSKSQAVYLSKVLKLTGDEAEGSMPEMIVELRDVALDYDEKGDYLGGRPQRQVFVRGNDDCRIYLDVVMKDAPEFVPSKPLVWKGKFEYNVNTMKIKNPDVIGLGSDITAFIGSYSLAIVELRVVYDEQRKMYAAEFSGRMSMTELLKYVYRMLGSSTNKVRSKLFYADIKVDSFRVYEDGKVGLDLEVGIGLPQLKVGPFVSGTSLDGLMRDVQTGGVEGRLRINTIEGLYSVYFGLTMPNLYDVGTTSHSGGLKGEIGIFTVDTPLGPIPFPDKVVVDFRDNLGMFKIPQIPVTINQVGGGVYNLHKIRDAIEKGVYPDFGAAFWIGITDTESPIIFGRRALSAQDCKIYVGTDKITLSGTGYLYHIPFISGEIGLMFHPAVGAYAKAVTNILDVLVGESKVELSYNYMTNHFYMGGYTRGYINIPEGIKFLPKGKLTDVAASINTDFIQAYVILPVLNAGLGVRYTWARPFDLPELFLYNRKGDEQASAYRYTATTEDGVEQIVEIGSNLYAIEVRQRNLPDGIYLASLDGMAPMHLGAANIQEFYSDGNDPMIIQATYPKGSEIMPLTLTDPDGREHDLITEEGEEQNVYLSEYKPEDGEAQNYIAIMVPAEKNIRGTWTITTNIPADFEVLGLIQTPKITSLEATQQDGAVNVEIDVDREAGPGYEYGVDLFIESAEEGNDTIIRLVTDAELNGTEGSYAVNLPGELETGDYRIIAGLKHYRTDGGDRESIGYTQKESGEIRFVNPNTPPAPANVTAEAKGNGIVNVKWDAVNDPDITGYYVFAADENGNIAEGATVAVVPAAEGVTRYETDINEWETGRDYNVVVQAVKEVYREQPEPGEDIVDVDSQDISIREIGDGVYSISWSRLEGIDSYSITLEDGADIITIPYYSNESESDELTAIVRELKPGMEYSNRISIKGFKKKELIAKNINAEDTGPGSKQINWDSVQDNETNAYIIGAQPVEDGDGENLPLVFELREGDYTLDAQTGRCSAVLDGFVEDVEYEITISAKEKEKEVPARYLGALSQPVLLTLPVPQPPEIDIIGKPTDAGGNGAVQVLYGDQYEGYKAYFLTNVKETSFAFVSDSAVRSEVTVTGPSDTAQVVPVEMNGSQWELSVVLEEGINRITIKAFNRYGDFTEKTWMVSCKTSAPSLFMNETAISGENAVVSGITDTEATVYINSVQAEPDGEGFFSIEVPHGNRGHFDITVRAVDRHLNENIFRETVVGGNMSAIERVAIETGGSVETGRILPLKLFAYDAAGDRMEIPAGYVTWSIARGEDTARIENGGLRAVKKGQCVVAAGYSVSGDYTWTDMAVVDILGVDAGSEEADVAYLMNITASSGTLSPAFSPYITTYSITTPYNLASIWLRPETGLENAVIRVDGQIVENGTSSGQLVLDVGKNTFEIVVEAPELQATTYTINIYREEYKEEPPEEDDDTGDDDTGDGDIEDSDDTGEDTGITGAGSAGSPVLHAGGKIYAPAAMDAVTKTAATELSAAILNNAFNRAALATDGKKKVAIELPPADGAKAYELIMPAGVLSNAVRDRTYEITTGAAMVTIPCNMLGSEKVQGKASLTIAQADPKDITDREARERIGGRPVIQLSLKVDGKPYAWSNEDAPVTVSIPYEPTAEELADSEHITIWYIDGSGNVVEVPSGRYNPETGMVTFTTTHFSKFAVVYVTRTFNDLESAAWAKKAIEVLASKGILKGITETEYAPQTYITRADFLYWLIKVLGVDAKVDGNFDDIDKNAYYYREIAIARKLGITNGTGNNEFSPDRPITRQDMMVLAERALRTLDKIEARGTASDLDGFTDKSLVAAYAAGSVASVVREGLIIGSGGRINPLGHTTRAEAAMFLYRIYNKQ